MGPSLVRVGDAVVLLEPQPGDRGAIYVFGAGHVGRALVPILANVPGAVVWIDPREGVFPVDVPAGVEVRASDAPEDEVDGAPAAACFVVLTHDHGLDLRIVEAVLRRGEFAYLGLIGSTTKRTRFERRLASRGIAAAAIARLRCPIGVEGITGRHPGEIAVAVAAEILQHRSIERSAMHPNGA